jgi:LacI family transcriptional regulator
VSDNPITHPSRTSRRITLKDVAAECGISRATVSLVIREEPRVAEATRKRVLEAMARLNYVYDRRAAVMRTQRTMTVGLVVTDILNPFFAELAMALEVALNEHGYAVLLGYSRDDRDREDRLLGVMVEHRVDGVFLLPSQDTSSKDLALRLGDTPHVLIARRVAGHEAAYVGVDNVQAGRLLGEHFAERGFREVAFLGGPERSTAGIDRQRGLAVGLRRSGLELGRTLSIPSDATRAGGLVAAKELLTRGTRPDVIACYNDVVAFGVFSGLRAAGLEPGRDIALASFDDIPEAELQHPPLTSVATYPEQVGAEAGRLLRARIEDPDLPPSEVLIPPKLSIRASTMGSHRGSTGIPG